jgi:hypothetical protein
LNATRQNVHHGGALARYAAAIVDVDLLAELVAQVLRGNGADHNCRPAGRIRHDDRSCRLSPSACDGERGNRWCALTMVVDTIIPGAVVGDHRTGGFLAVTACSSLSCSRTSAARDYGGRP